MMDWCRFSSSSPSLPCRLTFIHFLDIQSVQFSCSVVSNSLWSHELQHTRPPCPSPTPGIYPNSCPSSRWCHPTISSSVFPFSSCPQSLPASGSFPMSQLFASGGQSIGVSASASVPPMNTQDWSPLGWTGYHKMPSKQRPSLWVFPLSSHKETPELGKITGFSSTWTISLANFTGFLGNITEIHVQASQSEFLWVGFPQSLVG